MNAVKDDVEKLVEKELKSANEEFPQFNSVHEGYAVIKEEIEEAKEALDEVMVRLEWLWSDVKHNRAEEAIAGTGAMIEHAINGAVEFIQVAAMAQKLVDMKGANKDE